MKTIAIIITSVLISISAFLALGSSTSNTQIDTDFVTLKDIGQIALDNDSKLKIQAFANKDVRVDGNNVIINAGDEFIELRVGNTSKIRIERENIYLDTKNLFINNKKYGE